MSISTSGRRDFLTFTAKIMQMTSVRANKYESEVSDSNVGVGEPTESSIDLQLLRNQIVKEYRRNDGFGNHDWITLEKESLVKLVLETFADDNKRDILHSTLYNPKTITEILGTCKIPKTSGYRIINSMIENYLLAPKGSSRSGNRIFKKYASTIENVQIETEKNKIIVRVKFAKSRK